MNKSETHPEPVSLRRFMWVCLVAVVGAPVIVTSVVWVSQEPLFTDTYWMFVGGVTLAIIWMVTTSVIFGPREDQ